MNQSPQRKKVYISVHHEAKQRDTHAGSGPSPTSNVMLKGRRLTDSTTKNLSEARRRIARRSRMQEGRYSSNQPAGNLHIQVPTNIVLNQQHQGTLGSDGFSPPASASLTKRGATQRNNANSDRAPPDGALPDGAAPPGQ